MILTSTGSFCHLKLTSMAVSTVQLQQHGIYRGSWRSKLSLPVNIILFYLYFIILYILFIFFNNFIIYQQTLQDRATQGHSLSHCFALPHLFVYVFLTVGFLPFQCVFSTLSNENEIITCETQNFPNVHFLTLSLYLAGRQPPTDNHTHPLTNKYMQIPA